MKSLFCLLLTPMICYQCASPIHRVALDLTSLDVTVCLAKGGHGESFGSMVKRLKPVAAITGDFYNPMTLKSVGDIVVDGKILYDGCIGPALVISKNGSPP
jgi:exopolysaccharide biosynthesis protein